MIYVLYLIHVVVSIFLILVVLLQQGKGADLSVFGGGTTQAAFGARGATLLIHKLTVGSFIGFIFTTLAIGVIRAQERGAGSVMSDVAIEEPATPAGEEASPEPTGEVSVPEGAPEEGGAVEESPVAAEEGADAEQPLEEPSAEVAAPEKGAGDAAPAEGGS